jgi:hypothetical protein
MNKFYVKTPKAESEGSKLSTDLKRMLTYMEGYLASDELAKRAPPSLREKWKELLKELLDGGYIVVIPDAKADRRATKREEPVAIAETPAKHSHTQKAPVVAPAVPEKIKNAEVPTAVVSPQTHQNSHPKTAIKQQVEAHPSSAQRMQNLLIENESLMKLLTDAYVEIEKLKAAQGTKK